MPMKRSRTRKRKVFQAGERRRLKDGGSGPSRAVVRLTPAQEQEYRRWSNATFARRRSTRLRALAREEGPPRHYTVVAEGDSWFDYKPSFLEGTPVINPGRDLLGHLQAFGRFSVFRVSKAGDTMENMVYGTDTKGHGPNEKPHLPPEIEDTIRAIRDKRPDAFLFSAGGNDVAGVDLEAYLNHADSGLPPLREDVVTYEIDRYVPTAFAALIARVRSANATLPIFIHGYDYPTPDGRPVIELVGWSFIGPWLKPALTAKRHTDLTVGRQLLRQLIDRFNAALQRVAAAHAHVYYINLRGTLSGDEDYRRDWVNELHPTSDGFKKLAGKVHDALLRALGG
jgi:lysophospholipase L1-like esterase